MSLQKQTEKNTKKIDKDTEVLKAHGSWPEPNKFAYSAIKKEEEIVSISYKLFWKIKEDRTLPS